MQRSNKNKWLAILFGALTYGGVQETLSIASSGEHSSLAAYSLLMTALFVYLTIRFWRAHQKQHGR